MREYSSRARACNLTVDVPADGVFNAEIAVIAEAPGEREAFMRMPLVGGSGKYLWDVLKKYNLSRQNTYVTNVIKRQVSLSTRSDKRDPVRKDELVHWENLLRWELSHLPNLKYIVLLGSYALKAISQQEDNTITNWRGTVLDNIQIGDKLVKALVTFNPAYIMREPKMDVVFRMDIAKLERLRNGQWKKPEITSLINPGFGEAFKWIDQMHDEGISGKPVAGDIETISGETACVGLGNSPNTAMCINFRDRDSNRFSISEERQIRVRLQRMFNDTRVKLVFQNGMYDSYFMWLRDRIRIRKIWFDTMLSHHTLYPRLPHSLGFQTAQYTDLPYYKDEFDEWKEGGTMDSFWEYNCKDVCVTLMSQQRQLKELEHFKMDKFFFDHVMRLQPYLVEMVVGGVKVDMNLKSKIAEDMQEDLAKKLTEFHARVHEATGDPEYFPNPMSPKQLASLFFYRLKLVGRGMSTDDENRKRMREHPRTPEAAKAMIDALGSYKEDQKFYSTYVEMKVSDDGRMRTEYKQTGTQKAPGRLSSSALLIGEGGNLQNQPGKAHQMFIADPGYAFGYLDLSQAEARYVAWDAKIDKWKEQFERARLTGGYDAHRALASEMFNVPYDDVPKEDWDANGKPTIRYIAKRCRHGLNYRMGPDRLATTAGLTSYEAQRNYNIYHRVTPELMVWWDKLEQEAKTSKVLYNSYGRRLIIMERIDETSLESIVAFKPQSSIGDKINRVIYMSREDSEWPIGANVWEPIARPMLNIHDALICLAPIDKIEKCLQIMCRHAEEPLIVQGEQLIIPAEPKISKPDEHGVHRWSTLEKVKLEW